MKRRQFLFSTVALAVAGAMGLSRAGQVMAAEATSTPLPIPPVLQANADGQLVLTAMAGQSHFSAQPTTTFGYNGALLGPVLRFKRGEKVQLRVENQLPEMTTFHLHGLAIAGGADGGPHSMMASGSAWETSFTVDQPAATCWYHPHSHGSNGYQVAMGLAGMVVIDDEPSAALPLPSRWGIDDIPVILQDKRLKDDGQIDYTLDVMTAAVGWFGDVPLVNGVVAPTHAVPQGWVRLRLLNGCNARSMRLALSNQAPLHVIASDGGLLPQPVTLPELVILPGERFEVMAHVTDALALMSLPVDQMGMTLAPYDAPFTLLTLHADPSLTTAPTELPLRLVDMPALPDAAALSELPERRFQLSMAPELDEQGMMALMQRYGHKAMGSMSMESMNHGAMQGMEEGELNLSQGNRINGKAFDMHRVDVAAPKGQFERWVISGEGDMMLHPFHIHGTQFRILSENGQPPAAHRAGWKDMVMVEGAVSEVLIRFDHEASEAQPYMAHCHLLEHEDTGMMMSFTVS